MQHIKLRFIPRPARLAPIGLFAGVELSGGGPGGVPAMKGVRGRENGDAKNSGVAGVVGCGPPWRMTWPRLYSPGGSFLSEKAGRA